MKATPLEVLDGLLRSKPRDKRSNNLLKAPFDEEAEGWHMCVPSCFNEALDIRQTERRQKGKASLVWTQGSRFAFKRGDIIYDTAEAYGKWSEALTHVNLAMQVKVASDARPARTDSQRKPGKVTIRLLVPEPAGKGFCKRGEVTTTQDEFVRLLIEGPTEIMKAMIGPIHQHK